MRKRFLGVGQTWVNIDRPPQCLKCGATILAKCSSDRPAQFADLVKELKVLVAATQAKSFDSWKEYPEYERIREIGESLDEMGGLELMQKAYYSVRTRELYFSQDWWDGVGSWQA
jgi:hypothetical protein